MLNEIFGRESLKDYCPISIVKEEADWEYTSGVLAQEVYSLYLNNTLELNKNTMLIHCIWIQYTIYSIWYIIYNILYIVYNLVYIINCVLQTIYNVHCKQYTIYSKQPNESNKKIIFNNLKS
jgi:hypothetical protein